LLFGAAGLKEFSNAIVHAPAVVALRARTKARLEAASPRGAATASVRTYDGRQLEATVLHAKGSMEQPLSDREIEVKVRELAPLAGIDALFAAVWQLDSLTDIGPLLSASR
jgi:2-methylcitrate dehydratase PrpD